MPVLRSLHWPGVLNLKLGNLRDLKVAHVREMIANGWEVDSHTINHPSLTAVDDARLRYELEASKARLKKEFRYRATGFEAVQGSGTGPPDTRRPSSGRPAGT